MRNILKDKTLWNEASRALCIHVPQAVRGWTWTFPGPCPAPGSPLNLTWRTFSEPLLQLFSVREWTGWCWAFFVWSRSSPGWWWPPPLRPMEGGRRIDEASTVVRGFSIKWEDSQSSGKILNHQIVPRWKISPWVWAECCAARLGTSPCSTGGRNTSTQRSRRIWKVIGLWFPTKKGSILCALGELRTWHDESNWQMDSKNSLLFIVHTLNFLFNVLPRKMCWKGDLCCFSFSFNLIEMVFLLFLLI